MTAPSFGRVAVCLSLAAALLFAAEVPAKTVKAAAVALVIDGEPTARPPLATDHDSRIRRRLYDIVVPLLHANGFVVLPTADLNQLIGARALLSAEIAWLHIDTRPLDFEFNVVLLPPRWSKRKAGAIRLFDAHNDKKIWAKSIKVKYQTREGAERREAAIAKVREMITELRPARSLRGHTVRELDVLLAINDVDNDDAQFLDAAKALTRLEEYQRPDALVELASHTRLRQHPDLRVELVRQAVVVGGDTSAPALQRALASGVLSPDEDRELSDLLVEALGLLGVPPGIAFRDHLDSLDLSQLLGLRRRFRFDQRRDEMDRLIERRALAEVERSATFSAAERRIRKLPLQALSRDARVGLRDSLYSRITPDDAGSLYARLLTIFPESIYPPPREDHLDQQYVAGAADLVMAPEHIRLAYYEAYLRCAPRAGAAARVATVLGLESRLEARLVDALHHARTVAAAEKALQNVYGPRPAPQIRAAFGRALVAALGDDASDDDIRAIIARHPDLPEVVYLTRARGLARDRDAHVFPVRVGDSLAAVERALGPPDRRREHLSRRDLSPAAVMVGDQRVPSSQEHGFTVLEYKDRARLLLKDGRVFRIVIEASRGRYHHGIRTGESRGDALAALGAPSSTRGLMFGRELVEWHDLDGAAKLSVVFDSGRIKLMWEEEPTQVKSMLASLW